MMDDQEFLERLHAALRPRAYLQLGGGGSALRVSRAASIAVDPDLRLDAAAERDKPWLKVYREPSDVFLRERSAAATLEGHPLDLVLIAGTPAFARTVRDLELVERWGHAETLVAIGNTLPKHAWQASRAFHDGAWTGDVWRIVPFLRERRPDLVCTLVATAPAGLLLVTGLDPESVGMTALADTLDHEFPRDGPAYEALVDAWLRDTDPIPPDAALRALDSPPRTVGHRVTGHEWTARHGRWVSLPGAQAGHLTIVPDEPIRSSHRATMSLQATGVQTLLLQVHYEIAGAARHRNIYLDIDQPGALFHGLDSLRLAADSGPGSFELDWEGSLAPGESLTHITVGALDWRWQPVGLAPGSSVALTWVELQECAWPRPGTLFAAERFPERPPPAKRSTGKRDAVVFAWWTPDSSGADMVGEYYLGLLRYHHSDSKIFVGVNHGTAPRWIDRLAAAGLDVEMALADPAIDVPSDCGGFLAALAAYARNQEEFDLVWFGHTKGASRRRFDDYAWVRFLHDRRFWSRRREVERFFADPAIGLYSHRYGLHDSSPDVPWRGFADLESLNRVYRDTHAPLGLWAWETVFVMRHGIVKRFCDIVGDAFFRLDPKAYGAGRWWFEAAFPSIASMQGFEPWIALDTDSGGSQRSDVVLYDDPRQTNRLAMAELMRWREDPFGFEPRALPRGFT